jgi:phosphoribosylformimino-5-aminoimidazole carboxamide ribonucleotide (ProFAR) isomerase
VSPPWVLVARAYGEAKSPIEIGGGIEVAHGVDDMIEAAGHRYDTTPTGYARPLPR